MTKPNQNLVVKHFILISFKLFSLSDIVIGMSCINDCDCQDVLLNTVCTSNKCTCAAGFCFSGSGILLFIKVDWTELNVLSAKK